MARYKKKLVVGNQNSVHKKISKPLFNLIVSFQKELQSEENCKNKYKPKKVSFIYASLELSRRIKI